jgi:chromosome segregation ATPase
VLPVLDEKTQPMPFDAAERSEPESKRRRRSPEPAPQGIMLVALVSTLAALALIGLLSVFWFRELERRKDAEGSIASAQAQVTAAESRVDGLEAEIAVLEDDLAAARLELKPWRLSSQRRADALRSTRGVMGMVAPVREGYDDLGEALTTIEGDTDALATAASALERQVATLNAYVQQTPAGQLSKRKLRELVTTLRARKAASTSAHASFAEGQSGYGDAAELVDARFEQLTRAITTLRKQIDKALRR